MLTEGSAFYDSFEIVPFSEEHCKEAAEIELASFSDPWSEASLKYLCPSAVTTGFAVIEKTSGRLAAYGGMEYVLDEGNIINIATHPDFRRRGCARALLERIKEFSEEKRVDRIVLEVRASNTGAYSLYRSFGFRDVGIMPDYYSKPKENAIVMAFERKK